MPIIKLWHTSDRTTKTRAEDYAEEILNREIDELFSIQKLTRKNSYNAKHTGTTKQNEYLTRIEERIALDMFGKEYAALGKIIDYQVPLKNVLHDKGIGKIDLLSYDESKQILTFLELKKPDSEETLLRAVLEVFTYWKIVNQDKLLCDFGLPENTKIQKAVLLFENSYAYNEYVNNRSPKTTALMKRLDVDFFGIKRIADSYEVFSV